MMTKKQTAPRTNGTDLETLELEFLSQVSGGAKSGKNPRSAKGFTTYYHPKVVTKWVYRSRR